MWHLCLSDIQLQHSKEIVIDIFPTIDIEFAIIPLRIITGLIMLDSGIGKWSRGISGTGRWFESLGFPAPQLLARFVATVEAICGLLLIIGFFTQVSALLIMFNMFVATLVQKYKLHAPFQGGDVQGYELDILLMLSAFTLVMTGGGSFSIDAIITQ